MRRRCAFALMGLFLGLTLVVSVEAGPATQFGLYNSGVDDNQIPLQDNDVDPHYELVDISHILGDPIVATSAGGFPIGPWLPDSDISAWITPSEDTNGPGDFDGLPSYVYRTTFDLTGVDINNLQITGRWSSDNSGQDILLNDFSLGFVNTGQFAGFAPFMLDGDFVQGINTLDFVINNGAGEDNPDGPTGLRVEFEGNGLPLSHRDAISGLFNTGVDDNGVAFFGGIVPDPHYQIVLGPEGDPLETLTVLDDGYPINPNTWRVNTDSSRWIGPPDVLGEDNANGDPGLYLYETTFDMTGRDIENFAISGNWSTDDGGPTILLNGFPLTEVNTRGFNGLTWFGINAQSADEAGAEVLPGENTLTFHVENGGADANPTGLRVDQMFARAAPLGSTPIPGLLNTGLDENGFRLADDEEDPNYTQTAAPDGADDPATALSGPPVPPWVDNTGSSRWIGPSNDAGGNGPPGDYEYEIEFDLTGLDPSTAVIMGLWSADNTGGDILLNGEPTDNAQQGSFPTLSEFEISAAAGHNFLPGSNTLTFLVNNAGDDDNPIGLRVEGLVAYAFTDGGLAGDYNKDGVVDTADIDLQAEAMKDANPDLEVFDENGDGRVDIADREVWVEQHARTWFGDSNFDKVFDSGDLVFVFDKGKYDTQEMATWADGDWDGNMEFNSGDLVVAFAGSGYDKGQRPARAAVPEPSSILLFLVGALFAIRRQR